MTKNTLTLSLATLFIALAMASTATANHTSIDSFPAVTSSFRKAVDAWNGYLGHCVQSGVGLYAFESSEHPDVDGAYAFVPQLGSCEIYFNVDQGKNYKKPWFCSVMVHEMGHVAGFDHNADSRDIMNETGEIYWRKCLSKKQARTFKRRRKIIDRGISSWAYASSSRRGAADPKLTRDLRAGRLEVRRIATLPVP